MNGLVREIIRKPTFKDILRGHLNNMSAEGGRRLVRDLIWQDFEAVFGLMGSLPAFINACAGGLTHSYRISTPRSHRGSSRISLPASSRTSTNPSSRNWARPCPSSQATCLPPHQSSPPPSYPRGLLSSPGVSMQALRG